MSSNSLVTVRSVIEDLIANKGFHISYISFMQGYKAGKAGKEIDSLILPKKKFTRMGYYLNESQVDKFKELILNRFN